MHHTIVYREPGRYGGWPANYGIWSWGNEVVVGFTAGHTDVEGGFHTCDHSRPFVTMQARSLDGGESWEPEPFPGKTPGGRPLSADEHMEPRAGLRVGEALSGEDAPTDCPSPIDFTRPAFALMCARTGLEAGVRSFFYASDDRCRSWAGPYWLPTFDQTGIAARTDCLVSGPGDCMLFLTANKGAGKEGRIFCTRTTDGGRTFEFVSWIGEEPAGYAIMPASVRLPAGRILVAIRCRGGPGGAESWIDLYTSDDDGATWACCGRPVADTGQGGNPPTLTRLHDGRLCLTYGFRDAPFGIRARISSDDGATWSEEVTLRDDGGCHDLGYPRTVLRPDGMLVTVYYFNDEPEGDRYIAATVWQP